MRLTWKDGATTVMVAVIAAIYAAQTLQWGWPLIGEVRIATLAVGALGLGMCIVGADPSVMTARTGYTVLATTLGAAAGTLTIVGVITGWSVVLTALVLITVLLYVIATSRHLLGVVPMARPA